MSPRQIGPFSPDEVAAILVEQNAQDRFTWTAVYIRLMEHRAKEGRHASLSRPSGSMATQIGKALMLCTLRRLPPAGASERGHPGGIDVLGVKAAHDPANAARFACLRDGAADRRR